MFRKSVRATLSFLVVCAATAVLLLGLSSSPALAVTGPTPVPTSAHCDSGAGGTAAGNSYNTGTQSCSTPTKSESELYGLLKDNPGSIKMLTFNDNVVTLQLNKSEKDGDKFDVTVGDLQDRQAIRELALAGNVSFRTGDSGTAESDLYVQLKDNASAIKQLEFKDNSIAVTPQKGSSYSVTTGGDVDQQALRSLAVAGKVSFTNSSSGDGGGSALVALLVVVLILLVIACAVGGYFLFQHHNLLTRRSVPSNAEPSQQSGIMAVSGGNSPRKAKKDKDAIENPEVPKLTFADVIGQDPAKKALRRILRLNSHPETMKKHDARIPKGVLLHGGPGLGKTLLARALAGESGLTIFQINASVFMEQFVGVGAKRVRDLVEQAVRKSEELGQLVIIYIDEIDAIGKKRTAGSSGHDEQSQTLLALLGAMDGFETRGRLLFLASTNQFNELDPALTRPGRFDEKVTLKSPGHRDRVKLFQHYTRNKQVAVLDFDELARKASGLSGAGIDNVCNFAAVEVALQEIGSPGETPKITQELMLAEIANEHARQPKNSVARRVNPSENTVRMDHVIGQDGAKELCQDILDFFEAPHKFTEEGIKPPRGTLFKGGPGEGKTLLAQAVAGEAGVPFYVVSGSDFVETLVGRGAARVRELFEEAEANAPCLLFIDEIDAVGGKRSADGGNGGHQEREQTLNQLLVCMDGANSKQSQVVIIAATNRDDMLDDALTRPGRFDRSIELTKPDYAARLKLFQFYTRDRKLADDVDLEFFAHNTAGFSAAGIASVCNEAWLHQSRMNRKNGGDRWNVVITAQSIDEAILSETMGGSVNRIMSQAELLNTAVHEIGGHACIHHVVTGGELMARMTIIGRGQSLGHVQYMNDDKYSYTKQELLNRITSALAGRVAQDILLDTVDTGAASDFQQAYKMARAMVVDYGMSPLGVIIQQQGVPLSDDKLAQIEEAVKDILDQCEARARRIVVENEHCIWHIVDAIMVKETLLGPEFQALWNEALALDPRTTVFVHKPQATVARIETPRHDVIVDADDDSDSDGPVGGSGQVINAETLFNDKKKGGRSIGLGALVGRIKRRPVPGRVER